MLVLLLVMLFPNVRVLQPNARLLQPDADDPALLHSLAELLKTGILTRRLDLARFEAQPLF